MSVRLHSKHGVNPMLTLCFFCQEPDGLALIGAPSRDVREALAKAGAPVGPDGQAPHAVTLNKNPCQKCIGHMQAGVILISVDEAKSDDRENPYRTGGWVVVREDFIRHVLTGPVQEDILKKRVAFVPDEVWDAFGLPRGDGPS